MRRGDGFHPSRVSGSGAGMPAVGAGDGAEDDEMDRLTDETIILDSEFSDKGKAVKKIKKRSQARKFIKRAGLAILAFGLLTAAFTGWRFEHSISKVFHGNVLGFLHSTKLKGEDQGRVTILLAGNSADDPGHEGSELTDSIMLVSLDTVHNSGYLLSIPRDLWVNFGIANCPYGNSGKINAVYECGQALNFSQDGYPKGGMGLLEKVVNQDFGVNINYYSLIDYSALRDAVNAVGGVSFTVNSPECGKLYDGNRDYTTHGPLVNLTNGLHVLNGQQALDLSRARGDPPYPSCGYAQGDFTRTQNQRQLLLNLKSKILSLGTLSNPVKINSLLNVIGNNVQTDFHVDEIKRFYDITKNIPNNAIQSVGLADANVNLVRTGAVGDQSAVIPVAGLGNFGQIQAYVRRLGSNDPVIKEAATAVVLNGSNTAGLASKTGAALTDRGLNIKTVDNTTAHPSTVIVALNANKPATKSYLQKKFGVTATTNLAANPEAKYYSVDFVIILGANASSN